jgi:4-diphosphocytidyl-2-C-methyl-D-erythritol kinase
MDSLTVQAFAKINLTLDVFNKRSDGYHSLASVMQTISLHDTINITALPTPEIELECEGETVKGVPSDSSNLVWRAARSVLDVAHCESGLRIRLRKQVPSQAGLGGGSSDAAATLLGVTTLFGFPIGPKLLHDLAVKLGSDVPFFLMGGTAVVRGIGDNLSPIADAPTLFLVVVKPEANISTAWAYGALDAIPDRASNRATRQMETAIKESDVSRIMGGQSNDFEPVVFREIPAIAWLRDELQMAGARVAHLCGSGSAVYGVADDEAHAERIAALVRKRHQAVWVARTLSRVEANPLREPSK